MRVTLVNAPENSPNFCFGLYDEEGGCVQFVQSDWDYVGLASSLGWRPCEHCNHTDGTVDCEHHITSEMLADAFDWLYERDGETFDIDYCDEC